MTLSVKIFDFVRSPFGRAFLFQNARLFSSTAVSCKRAPEKSTDFSGAQIIKSTSAEYGQSERGGH